MHSSFCRCGDGQLLIPVARLCMNKKKTTSGDGG